MVERLLDNPRTLTAKVAALLDGKAIERPQQRAAPGRQDRLRGPKAGQVNWSDTSSPRVVPPSSGRSLSWLRPPLPTSFRRVIWVHNELSFLATRTSVRHAVVVSATAGRMGSRVGQTHRLPSGRRNPLAARTK